TALGWVVLAGFLLVTGLFFHLRFTFTASADSMSLVLGDMWNIIVLVCPLLAMRLLAEEKRMGTLEMLLTTPVSDTQIVIGKYAAAMVFFCALLAPSLLLAAMCFYFGNPEPGMLIMSYLGVFFTAAVLVAIGLFISSLSRNQVVAAAITYAVFFAMIAFQFLASAVWQPGKAWNKILSYVALFSHYESLGKGVFDSVDVVYFASVVVFFLFLTVRVLDARRWR
ncbi:MAG: ABC transporter permease subunit, partial [Planctomycetota bacterium]|nr:ABC transporter permease subunit [Planctomycetota bacterium]